MMPDENTKAPAAAARPAGHGRPLLESCQAVLLGLVDVDQRQELREVEGVPDAVAEAHELASAALKPPRVMVFPDSGHTFGAVHPYAGLTEELAQAMDETVKWLGRYL